MISKQLYFNYMETPIGELELCSGETELLSVLFTKTKNAELSIKQSKPNPVLIETQKQLEDYFNKKRTVFNLPLKPKGTEFQNRVWSELVKIPFAKTTDYLTLAKKLGDPKCIRAAAASNGRNPISIIIPCHRVIGSDGKLVGYSGDLWRKKWMLDHESDQASLF